MKIFAALIVSLLFFTSCSDRITAEGDAVTHGRTVDMPFNRVDVSDIIDLVIKQNTSRQSSQIEVTTNENIHRYIKTYVSGTTLKVELQDNVSLKGKVKVTVKLYINAIEGIEAEDAATVVIDQTLNVSTLGVTLSDASSLNGNIICDVMDCKMQDASVLNIWGNTKDATIKSVDAASANNFGMVVDNLNCQMADASKVQITVNNMLSVKAKDASVLEYKGNCEISHCDIKDIAKVIKVE